MKIFSQARELFWPLLEQDEIVTPKEITIADIAVDDKHLEKVLDFTLKRYDAEEDRKKTIESKSSLFIGTISVLTSVAIAVTTVLVNSSSFSVLLFILLLLLITLAVYMARTVWFSVKALERRNYHVLSVTDFNQPEKDCDYFKKLIAAVTNKMSKNSITINSKVDSMVMAQEYFKRAVMVVVVYAFVILLFYLSKYEFSIGDVLDRLVAFINLLRLSGWSIVCLSLLTFVSLLLNIRANLLLNRSKRYNK